MLRGQPNGQSLPAPALERKTGEPEANPKSSLAGPSKIGSVVEVPSALLTRLSEAIECLNKTIVDRQASVSDSPPAVNSIISIAKNIARIADKMDPPPPDVVDSTYIAAKLGCTTTWVAEMARSGGIPKSCVVPGTGNGKPWKFYRLKTEEWLASR
jgi:hypothetical protein